jgi:hypothetical protein
MIAIDDSPARISARRWGGFPVVLGGTPATPLLIERPRETELERYARAATFEEFLALADATDERIAAFADHYGLLGLCAHGEPMRFCDAGRVGKSRPRPRLIRCSQGRAERVSDWRRWAVRLRAIVEVGKILRAGGKPTENLVDGLTSDLEHLDGVSVREALLRGEEEIADPGLGRFDRRWRFCLLVNRLLTLQAVIMPGTAKRPALDVQYGPGGLFGTLVLQAALAATGVVSLVICANCGKPFRAMRRPNATRRSYCEKAACKKASRRDASRQYRQGDTYRRRTASPKRRSKG